MVVPSIATPEAGWTSLSQGEKHERVLEAALALFREHGLDGASMPAVAAAAGASVGSLYRQFPSREDLVLALAIRRCTAMQARLDEAQQDPDAWRGLEGFLRDTLERYACDDLLARAFSQASERPEATAVKEALGAGVEELIGRARAQGTIRPDASRADVSLLFVAVRSVRAHDPSAWGRAVDLLLDGLRA